jgi:hypothetical protein
MLPALELTLRFGELFFLSRVRLDTARIDASLKSSVYSFMSFVKTILLAALVLLSFESFSLSLFTKGVLSRTARPIPPLLNAAPHDDASAAKMDPARTAAHFDLQMYGELTPRSGGFLIAKETAGVLPRRVIVVPHFSTMIFTPKLSRYISKSVLNI